MPIYPNTLEVEEFSAHLVKYKFFKIINRKKEIIAVFEDFIAIPINKAIKLMVTITAAFAIN